MSRMSTTCPNCALHLAVTAADLRVGQGYVRCGRCEKVFNALLSLLEDPQEPPQTDDFATGTTSIPVMDTPAAKPGETADVETADLATADRELADLDLADLEIADLEDADLDGSDRDLSGLDLAEPVEGESTGAEIVAAAFDSGRPAPLPIDTDADADDMEVVETLATGTFETIVLEGDGVLQTEEMVDEAEMDQRLQEIARQIGSVVESPPGGVNIAGEADPGQPLEPPAPTPEPEQAFEDALAAPPRLHRGWVAAAALLALLLAIQLVHHNRQSLAAHGWARSLMAPVYRLFNVTLEPRWSLASYDVRQLGGEAVAGAQESILLRATVLNRALHPQPPPMLRITLQDRFGNALATHDVPPQDYLPGAPPARLAADQRLDVEMLLPDPGSKAVGFEIDACLPTAAGALRCASQP